MFPTCQCPLELIPHFYDTPSKTYFLPVTGTRCHISLDTGLSIALNTTVVILFFHSRDKLSCTFLPGSGTFFPRLASNAVVSSLFDRISTCRIARPLLDARSGTNGPKCSNSPLNYLISLPKHRFH